MSSSFIIFLLALLFLTLSTTAITLTHHKTPQFTHNAYRFLPPQLAQSLSSSNGNDGIKCVACTAVLAIVENIAEQHSGDIAKGLETMCDWIHGHDELQSICTGLVHMFGPDVVHWMEQGLPPDQTCLKVGLCHNKQCRLFPHGRNHASANTNNHHVASRFNSKTGQVYQSANSWWQRIYDVFDKHVPLDDLDGDGASTVFGFRGTAWRGKDCNDHDATIHPGRRTNNFSDKTIDFNCNGISGVNQQTGRLYKDELCSVPQKGFILLSDSAGAHFNIPPQWFSPNVTKNDFRYLVDILENELDFPFTSMYTGYMDDYTHLLKQNTTSFYMKMKERNRCVHRDFQNIAVNGARTGAMKKIMKTLNRDQENDHPAVVFYSLVGNDICSPHQSVDHFTKPADFEQNVLTGLDYLESTLPAGSTVVFIGLVPGEFLYKTMHNQTHPIGTTYEALYDYMNCLEINPCWGFLNSNSTVRRIATEHAKVLSSVYDKIIKEHSYKNFDMIYHDFPLNDEILKKFIETGGKPKDLIAQVDGFHPSQLGNEFMLKYLYEDLNEKYPNLFGEINPNNEKIDQMFPGQGGY